MGSERPGKTASPQTTDNVYVSVSLSKETKRSLWIGFMLSTILTVATLGSAPWWWYLAFPAISGSRIRGRWHVGWLRSVPSLRSESLEARFLETVKRCRNIDERPASRISYYENSAEDAGFEGTQSLWHKMIVTDEVIGVKQVEVPPDGIAHFFWCRYLRDEMSS